MKSNGIHLFKTFKQSLEDVTDHVRYQEGIAFIEGNPAPENHDSANCGIGSCLADVTTI